MFHDIQEAKNKFNFKQGAKVSICKLLLINNGIHVVVFLVHAHKIVCKSK